MASIRTGDSKCNYNTSFCIVGLVVASTTVELELPGFDSQVGQKV